MSSDDEFKDTYGDIAEETSEPLEIESTDTTKATMPDENESKPNKSISRSMTTHLGLLKSKVDELRTFMDDRETVQAIHDLEIEEIQSMSNWIKAKASRITAQWEEFLETDYDEDERARAESTYNKCEDLVSKIKNRACKFIREKSGTAQAVTPTPVSQASSYMGPPRTNDMLKPKKPLDENMTLEAALHWFKTYKNHWS